MAERITLLTDDGVQIIGDWTPAPTMIGAAILLHMNSTVRGSWSLLTRALVKRGIGALAIDLRGHGDSTVGPNGAQLDAKDFSDEDFQSSVYDVYACVAWLKKRGILPERMVFIGASIGANLAIQAMADEPRLIGAALLSPGGDYHGVKALDDVQQLLPDNALYIVSSEDDGQSYADSRQLYETAPVTKKTFVPYKTAGHGTNMFSVDASLIEKIADWTKNAIIG